MRLSRHTVGGVVIALLWAVPAHAGTLVVENNADSGPGSLRQAIADAASGDTVSVPPDTYALTSGQLVVAKSLTIAGAGARATIITGNNASRVLMAQAGPVTVTGVAITGGNVAGGRGGGIYVNDGVTLTLDGVALTANKASDSGFSGGGGVWNNGTLIVTGSTVSGNTVTATGAGSFAGGGGIWNEGTLSLSNSTVSGNTAGGGTSDGGGGGLETASGGGGKRSVVTNTTFSNNVALSAGGVNGGTGGNIRNDAPGSTRLRNTIIAAGTGSTASNCFGTMTTEGHNLETANTCGLNPGLGDRPATNPVLGPLQNNGGPTDTHSLPAESPAIDGADAPACPPIDQRGVARPQPPGAGCDIGAFERAVPTVITTAANAISETGATLGGTVNPWGTPGSASFEYGRTVAYGSVTPEQGAGSGLAPIPLSATVGGLAPGTTYHFRAVATNDSGTGIGQDQSFTTVARISRFNLLRSRFRRTAAPTVLSGARRLPPRGSAFRYRLSAASATLRITIQQLKRGRRVGGRCRPQSPRLLNRPRCVRFVAKGTLRRRARGGRGSIRFSGRVGRRALPPGRYRATIRATAPGAPRASRPRSASFTIVAG